MKRRLVLLLGMLFTMALLLPLTAHATLYGGEDSTKIEFGSYPQTEIVGEDSQSGVCDKLWTVCNDYEVDAELYRELQSAEYDTNGDTTIGNNKYHRISSADATRVNNYSSNAYYYNWSGTPKYHYFRYDPIVWRILKQTGDDLYLMSDLALDAQSYNLHRENTTWAECTLRSWLNNNFYLMAFSSDEQDAIKTTAVVNASNSLGTDGGADTEDKIYLLAESETYRVHYGDTGYYFNYDFSVKDPDRSAQSSTYAKAMGLYTHTGDNNDCLGTCSWWLRTPGNKSNYACYVCDSGWVSIPGSLVDSSYAVRPVLHLDTSKNVWSQGRVMITDMSLSQTSYEYDGTEKTPTVTIDGLTENKDFVVKYENNTSAGTAKVTVAGMGDYDGYLSKTFKIKPISIEGMTAVLSQKSYYYNATAKKPTVNIEGLRKGIDYTVTYKNNVKIGQATAVITGAGNYGGTITKTFRIGPAKAALSKVKRGTKKLTAYAKKQAGGVKYQFYVKRNGKNAKYYRTSSAKKVVKKLTRKKTYTVKVRAYKVVNGKTYYGAWSKVKKVKVK